MIALKLNTGIGLDLLSSQFLNRFSGQIVIAPVKVFFNFVTLFRNVLLKILAIRLGDEQIEYSALWA